MESRKKTSPVMFMWLGRPSLTMMIMIWITMMFLSYVVDEGLLGDPGPGAHHHARVNQVITELSVIRTLEVAILTII